MISSFSRCWIFVFATNFFLLCFYSYSDIFKNLQLPTVMFPFSLHQRHPIKGLLVRENNFSFCLSSKCKKFAIHKKSLRCFFKYAPFSNSLSLIISCARWRSEASWGASFVSFLLGFLKFFLFIVDIDQPLLNFLDWLLKLTMKLISSTKLIHNFLKEIQDLNEDISDVLLTLWGPDHSTPGDRAKSCKTEHGH